MNILPEQKGSSAVDATQVKATSAPSGTSVKLASSHNASAAKTTAEPITVTPESAVSLQKDSSGRFFYRVTNAQTGQVILEFPPEAVRNVGAGIEEYVQQHARLGGKLETKG
jgi:hypothetical protein